MSRIKEAFQNKKAFIAFLTGGDPTLDITEQLIIEMEKAGADLIEIGIPFSDPVAEGPVIQAANERALAAGCTTDKLFQMVKRVREKVTVPLVFLTYANPIYTYGKDRFFKACNECGIDGVIVPDVPFEEKGEITEEAKQHGVDVISMVAPTSNERIKMTVKGAEGFVYCVSSLGVTGVRNDIKTDIKHVIDLIKEVTNTPCAIGFGISTPEQAKEMASISDGAIVGSAIVKIIEKYGSDSAKPVYEYVKEMKNAVNS